jgi:hypothetical protein
MIGGQEEVTGVTLSPRRSPKPRRGAGKQACHGGSLAPVGTGLVPCPCSPAMPAAPPRVEERLGHCLSPGGLGWLGREEFRSHFRFLHNIQTSRDVSNKSAVTGTGGRGDIWARTNETSPSPLRHGGCRVKQSQFASPAGTPRTKMPNKPNCPKRGTEAVSRSRPADRIPSIPLFYHSTIPVRCRWCKTNPISESRSVGVGDRSCETNPISGSQAGGRRSRLYKQTQFVAVPGGTRPQGRMCETKPIPATPGGARPEGRASWVDCAKRSQFRAVPNGPGLGDEGRGGQSCKTKPNLGRIGYLGDGVSGTHIVQDGPNSARLGPSRVPRRTKDAKRTQFPAGWVGRGLGTRDVGGCRAKQSQFQARHKQPLSPSWTRT